MSALHIWGGEGEETACPAHGGEKQRARASDRPVATCRIGGVAYRRRDRRPREHPLLIQAHVWDEHVFTQPAVAGRARDKGARAVDGAQRPAWAHHMSESEQIAKHEFRESKVVMQTIKRERASPGVRQQF